VPLSGASARLGVLFELPKQGKVCQAGRRFPEITGAFWKRASTAKPELFLGIQLIKGLGACRNSKTWWPLFILFSAYRSIALLD
jgi:hypothetical protein